MRSLLLNTGLCLLLPSAGHAAEAKPSYSLRTQSSREWQVKLHLINRLTGATIWKRNAVKIRGAYWSADRRAIAILDDRAGVWGSRDWYYRLILWRDGEKVRIFDSLPALRGADVNMYIRWSPDKHRFLLHESSVQGMADTGEGNLWCVHVRTMRSHRVGHGYPTKATWINSRRVRYWTGHLEPHPDQRDMAVFKETLHEYECRRPTFR